MKFTYLGTAAAEGIPAVFCNCEYCRKAQERGGRDVRTRSQSIINEDLLIDIPMDTYMHKLQNNLDLTKVAYLIVTHKHMDHFYPQELTIRGSGYSHDMVNRDLHIYCAQEVKDFYFHAAAWEADEETNQTLHWHILEPFKTVEMGQYKVTPLPASHMREGNSPFMYHIVDAEGKEVLYLHDSGYYKDSVWEYFKNLKRPVDMVSFDGTSGIIDYNRGGHMGYPEMFRVKKEMASIGVIGENTLCIANHFSHNGRMMYDDMVKMAGPEGILVSFDGMKVEI